MASVMLGDLDDFIAPGQACINPLFTTPEDVKAAGAAAESENRDLGKASMQLVLEDDGGPVDAMMVVEEEVKPDLIRTTGKQTAKVSLDDCLACSGCVTSAETVLITQQSTAKLRDAIDSRRYAIIVASISPQARASLADRFGLSTTETHARLVTFLRGEGIHHLVDSSLGADFSLLEAGEEFVQRYRKIPAGLSPAPWLAPAPTVALTSTRRFNVEAGREEPTPIGVTPSGNSGVAQGQASTQNSIDAAAVPEEARGKGAGTAERPRGPGELLVLTSACPGWVCYAEKTAPEALPCLSTVKSQQQIMGVLTKRVFPRAWNIPLSPATASGTAGVEGYDRNTIEAGRENLARSMDDDRSSRRVFHVSIAQCYDKKLEASRKDFRHDDLAGEAEVDLVLTIAELLDLIEERAIARTNATGGNPSVDLALGGQAVRAVDVAATDVAVPPEDPVDVVGNFLRSHPLCDLAEPLAPGFPATQAAVTDDRLSLFSGVEGEGAVGGNSGGYLEFVFKYAALRLFRVDLAGKPLVYREGRNPDFRETTLEVDGQTVLRFAYAYGFRNIQSVLAKARRGKCPYQFVEVMACPSGCVNGGGQIKPKKEGPRETRHRVERVSEVMRKHHVPRRPEDNPFVQAVYRELLACDPGTGAARNWFHTAYHNVPKLELSNPHMAPW